MQINKQAVQQVTIYSLAGFGTLVLLRKAYVGITGFFKRKVTQAEQAVAHELAHELTHSAETEATTTKRRSGAHA